MCVIYSRSAHVSTSLRDTRGCFQTTHLMNCHRRERSGVCFLCVCAANPRCFVPLNHCCVLIYCCIGEGSDTEESNRTCGEQKRLRRESCFVWSRCHLTKYELHRPNSHHHQLMYRGVTERDLIIRKHRYSLSFYPTDTTPRFFPHYLLLLFFHLAEHLFAPLTACIFFCYLQFHCLSRSFPSFPLSLPFSSKHSVLVFLPTPPSISVSLFPLQSLSPWKRCRVHRPDNSTLCPSVRNVDPLLS